MKLTLKQVAARVEKAAMRETSPEAQTNLRALIQEILEIDAKYPDVGRLDFSEPVEAI